LSLLPSKKREYTIAMGIKATIRYKIMRII